MNSERAGSVVGACGGRGGVERDNDFIGSVCSGVCRIPVDLQNRRSPNEKISRKAEYYKLHTVKGPVRVISICSVYVPGYMNSD